MRLLHLYPKAWRERYSDELEALMEDAPAQIFDVMKGTFHMRLKHLPAWAILFGFAIAGGLAGLGSSCLVAHRWKSTAALQMTPRGVVAANVGPRQAYDLASAQNELMRRIQSEFLAGENLVRPQSWPLLTPGYIPRLTFIIDSPDADPIQASAVTEAMIAKILRMSNTDIGITVVDPPRLQHPRRPNRKLFASLGLAAGLLLGVITMLIDTRRSGLPPYGHPA